MNVDRTVDEKLLLYILKLLGDAKDREGFCLVEIHEAVVGHIHANKDRFQNGRKV